LVEFKKELECHLGADAGSDAVTSARPSWLAPVITLLLAFHWLPILSTLCVYGLLTWAFREHLRQSGNTARDIAWEFVEAVFCYTSYPDNRYRAPGGTLAVWIPTQSMFRRRFDLACELAPLFAAVGVAFVAVSSGHPESDRMTVVRSASLLPVPIITVFVLQAPALSHLYRELRDFRSFMTPSWEQAVEWVRSSDIEIGGVPLRDHLFSGYYVSARDEVWHPLRRASQFDLPCATPALVHESVLPGLVCIEGPTQSGKTSIGDVGLAIQLIRGRSVPALDALGKPIVGIDGVTVSNRNEPSPMLVLDLKGDLARFNTYREECETRGQTFRFFTLELGKATSFFNPLRDLRSTLRPTLEFTEMVLNMLDLYHGFLYGRSYYSEQSRHLLLKTLTAAQQPPQSWEELYTLLLDNLDRREHKDVFELVGRIYALAQYPTLGAAPPGTDCIHMPSVFENNECVYFWLPALASCMTVVTVAKMALFSFLDAGRNWNWAGRSDKKLGFCFLDEGQVVCGQNMERVFQQASGSHISLVLSNQSRANLDTNDAPNLSHTIWKNTRLKQAFGLLDSREREDWIELSGETVGHLCTVTDQRGASCSTSVSWQEVVHSRLDSNIIGGVNNSQGSSLLYINGDAGLNLAGCIPRHIWCPYTMALAEYNRRQSTAWPTAPQTQPVTAATTVVNTQSADDILANAIDQYAALDQLFDDLSRPRRRCSGAAT